MVFNATFNNISVIWWRSVVLLSQITDKLFHIMLYRVHLTMNDIVVSKSNEEYFFLNNWYPISPKCTEE